MVSPEAILSAVAWSAGGFAAGWLTCTATLDLHKIKESIVPDDPKPASRPLRPHLTNRTLGVLLVVMAVLTVVLVAVSNVQKSQILDCQAEVNKDLVTALSARSKIADNDRAALDNLILAIVGNTHLSEEQRQQQGKKAIQDYVDTIAESKDARARVNMPDASDYSCGD